MFSGEYFYYQESNQDYQWFIWICSKCEQYYNFKKEGGVSKITGHCICGKCLKEEKRNN